MSTKTTTQFSMRLPENLKTGLQELSELSQRSQSQIATKAIAEYVERNQWRIQALAEAKKEADKGVFVSHGKIDTWLDTWGVENKSTSPKSGVSLQK